MKIKQSFIKDDIVKVFIDQIFLEKEIEKFKSEFANISDFSCMEVFKLFDRHAKGYLALTDFKDSMRHLIQDSQYAQAPSTDDIYLIFKRYDRDQDGKLSYTEFCQMLIPKDKYLGEKVSAQKSYYMSPQTLDLVKRVMKAHLNVE